MIKRVAGLIKARKEEKEKKSAEIRKEVTDLIMKKWTNEDIILYAWKVNAPRDFKTYGEAGSKTLILRANAQHFSPEELSRLYKLIDDQEKERIRDTSATIRY